MESATALNLAWVLLSAALVLFMQCGFCLLESGMARTKNSINVAIKNLVDLCVSGLLFWAVGFGLMFGISCGGWLGTSGFALQGHDDPRVMAFFLFQLVFCGTATTIISGASAERMRFSAYVLVAAFVSVVIYPVFGHWAWGGALGGEPGWLAKLGFIDFAGATVVHSVGGWTALAAIILIGPRLGRFPKSRRHQGRRERWKLQGHDLGLATAGVFILWFGWFGFNGGSTLALDERVPLILVNTNLAAAAGGVTAVALSWVYDGRPMVNQLLIGVVSGLVAITAGCHLMTPWSSIVIGCIGGLVGCGATYGLAKLKIDDVVGAVPTHAVAGVWGTLAVALLAPLDQLPVGGRTLQFGVQLVGVLVAFLWAFGGSLLVLGLLHRFMGLRATPKQERIGLNYAEHGASTAMIDLAAEMHRHGVKRQFDRPVSIDRHTEAGQIGKAYNLVLKQVSSEIQRRDLAESRYRDIVENAVAGIFQTTPEGTFQSANPALLEIYGDKSLEDLQRRTPNIASQLYTDEGRRDEFKRILDKDGIIRDFRSRVKRADGTIIWVSESARAVKGSDGGLLYYEGTVVDITDRIDAERLHRERDFAEAANEAKSQFLARMSHEMRTPLGGVINTLDLITEDMPPAQRTRFIEIAKQSAQTLLTLINDVLDLSRIEAGKLDLELVETELEQTVRIATEMLYHLARKKGLRLASYVSPDLPSRVLLDGSRLQQILVNLIGNAIKFTQSGEITVNVTGVRPQLATIKASSETAIIIRLEVADTGIGIAQDRMEKIFEVFTQADRSTTRRFGGSGLGLAICRQLVELMGGQIGVRAKKGTGTVFWLEIPAEPVTWDSPKDTSCLTGRQVLVCAPSHAETSAMLANIRAWGTNPTHCGSVDEACSLACSSPSQASAFEHILLDADLQEAWNLARIGKRLNQLATLPITWIGSPAKPESSMRVIDRPVHASALLNELLTLFSSHVESETAAPVITNDVVGDGRCVLVVDDNEVNRMVASEMLRRIGFEPIAFESARTAIEEAKRRPASILLMDCEMPDMDGIEATEVLRDLHSQGQLALPPTEPLSIIACTAQAVDGDRKRCLEAGMDHYITKPIRREDLSTVLSVAIRMEPPIHFPELLERCGDDRTVVAEVLKTFAKRGPEDIQRVAEAVRHNADQVSAAAHRIKGAASTLAAHELSRIADFIEETALTAKPNRQQSYAKSIKELELEMNRCIRWIESQLEELR
jgi:ammonium transporter, Amt family